MGAAGRHRGTEGGWGRAGVSSWKGRRVWRRSSETAV